MKFVAGEPVLLDPNFDPEELAPAMGLTVEQVKTLLPPMPYLATITSIKTGPTYVLKWDHLNNDGDEYDFQEHELRTGS